MAGAPVELPPEVRHLLQMMWVHGKRGPVYEPVENVCPAPRVVIK